MASSKPIPTSTFVTESAVIESSFTSVWHMIKLENFSDFWSALSKSETLKGASADTDIVKWTFKDGTVLEVKQEEHSVCCMHSSIPISTICMYICSTQPGEASC
jgi:hypothetical protein